MSLHYLVIRES